MSTWKVPVTRTAVQTRYVTVEADTVESAWEKALEEAPSEDWTGDTSSSEYALDDMDAELIGVDEIEE